METFAPELAGECRQRLVGGDCWLNSVESGCIQLNPQGMEVKYSARAFLLPNRATADKPMSQLRNKQFEVPLLPKA